jgi:hypothetical protein
MAINIVDFNPALHQKVRYDQQLYAVLLNEIDFLSLPPDAEVIIHFMTHDKIMVRRLKHKHNCVLKKELMAVEPHIIE